MFNFSKDNQELTPITYSSAAIKILPYSVAPNEECFRIHWHDRMEFLRVHRGEMVAIHGSNTVKVLPDSIVLFPPKMPHHAFSGNEQLEYDVLMFDVRSFYNDSAICQKYLPAIYEGRVKFNPLITHPDTIACFDEIINFPDHDSLELLSIIYRFFFLLFKHNVLEIQNEQKKNNVIRDAIEYLEENFREEVTAESLCTRYGYTAAHFCRKFKQETGLTPMNYLKIRRMEEAYKLLKTGLYNISEIAAHCGYTDANYFTRCFKSHFGFPPSQFKIQK